MTETVNASGKRTPAMPHPGQTLDWKPEHLGGTALDQHVPLIFWLAENLDPAAYVTLGAHGSASHLAVCQAVKALGLGTRCYSIAGTAIPLDPGVREHHEGLYAGFSKLLPAGWDEDGLQHFRCGTIDWLQVDGEQELLQLRDNWRSWRRRLSARSIITIHGLKSALSQPVGAWVNRLQNCHPWAELPHGGGLLLVAIGENQAAPVQWLLSALQSPQRALLQSLFARRGEEVCRDQAAPVLPDAQPERARSPQAAPDDLRQAERLQAQLRTASAASRAAREEADSLSQRLQQSHSKVAALEHELRQARELLQQQSRRLEDRFRELGQLTRMVEEREGELRVLREQAGRPPGAVACAVMPAGATDVPAAPPARALLSMAEQVALIAQSGLFDESWYRKTYPDVAAAGFAPIEHYLQYGAAERRNPSADFDTAWYCRRYPEAAASGLNPLVHYIRCGRDKGLPLRPKKEIFHA